ncbi:MAG: iron ABC transporter substrate-binding protein [Acidimicrobiales bacterium]
MVRRPTRSLAALVAVAVLSTTMLSCGGGDDELVIYSGRAKNLVSPLLERFSEETGIAIAVKYADTAELALLIEQEGDQPEADVFLSQSPGALGYLAGVDRLAALPGTVLEDVDERFRSSEGLWVGTSGRVRTLVYNTDLVDDTDLPGSVFELTEPRYAGQLGVAPTNGSFQDFVTVMRASTGDDETLAWLEGLVANGSRTYANNTAILQAVSRGEVPFGLVNHYYNERQLAEDPSSPTENHFFEGDLGSIVLTTGVGVVAGTDRAEEAERFVRFLLSEEAQRFFSQETFEYPLANDVEPVADLVPLGTIDVPRVDLNELGGGLQRTQELIESSGLERS